MYKLPIIPNTFILPTVLETQRMRLRPLTIQDVVRDYEAVMESEERLRTVFRPHGEWPAGLTLEQNTIELGWHQVEFQERTSFAYTVENLAATKILGCMYIYPTLKQGYDVEISMWVRQSQVDSGLDEHLFETVEGWINEVWPFQNPGYPGRTISFDEWQELS